MLKVKMPSIESMLEAGVHFGHQVKRKNSNMEKYIYSTENRNNVIDLYKTLENLEKASNALYEIAKQGKQIVFVGTKRQAAEIVKKHAADNKMLFVNQRWLGGTLTNYDSVNRNLTELKRLEDGVRTNAFDHYTKKERLLIERKIEALDLLVGGIRGLERKPGALVIVDIKREKTAVREALQLDIPIVAMVDTNSDPKGVSFVIPCNDDAIKSIELVLSTLADSIKQGLADKPVKEEKKAEPKVIVKEEKDFKPKTVELKKEEPKKAEVKKEEPKEAEKSEKKPASKKAIKSK